MLEKELRYFIDNQEELVKKYSGRFLVIKDQKIAGDYSSLEEAYENASSRFQLGTFIIQECKSGKDIYTATYHSVVFA